MQSLDASLDAERLASLETSVGSNTNKITALEGKTQTLYDATTGRRTTVYIIDDFNETVLEPVEPQDPEQQQGEGI